MSQETLIPIEKSDTEGTSNRESVVYNVEQLNAHIRQTLEGQLGVVWLQAEISNFKPHSSGHFYFSLKDSKAQISAIMFRGFNSKLKFKPHDGLEVIVRGRITVYEPRGTYQIMCESMEPVGAGALQKQFEQLKEKLKLEGLFEASRKKLIPAYPRHIAIVTSPTGAAIQDILNIMSRRAKNVQITLVPALVQGANAATSLVESLKLALKLPVDVVIIGRGGGSMEDLWSFNDEALARLISSASIPIISAVGHEVDFTICDFVADLRAPTPSAAAELVAKSSIEITQKLDHADRMLFASLQRIFNLKKQSLTLTVKRLIDPKKKLQDYSLRNDELLTRLEQSTKNYVANKRKDVQLLKEKLILPTDAIQRCKSKLEKIQMRLNTEMQKQFSGYEFKLQNYMSLLDSLSPLKVIDRGYAIVMKQHKVIRSVLETKKWDTIEIKLKDGVVSAAVTQIKSNDPKETPHGI
ncbi:MAG: exodeoxyribonuclease VII large subunit [Bdellovibrionaceae bacterium]|nr:exodeoxyribonuclease VII large subunit [Bdellovibrio sp.]